MSMKGFGFLRVMQCGLALVLLLMIGTNPAWCATLCVNPGGTDGCMQTINAAVAAAAAGDTINVAAGTYRENVVIGKPLSLIGANSHNTIIDASDLANGINVDGHNNSGLTHVVVNGLAVRNADFQGILVTDASDVSIVNNHVTGNDRKLQPFAAGGPVCPGLPPYFEAGEGFDCGEGIHLSGATHSTVANNVVENNAGGILLSDDTAPNHDNLISGNVVQDNPYDCGITIASHHFTFDPTSTWGVSHNTIVGNASSRNGLDTGEGAGVGLFAGPPGARTFANVVANNILTRNALPGVTMHSHSPNQSLNDNLIVGNQISGNGPDGDPGTTEPTGIVVFGDSEHGAPPITGTVISQNIIKGEGIDIAVRADGSVDAHFNNLFDKIGIWNMGSATVNGSENWWKCSNGPGANGCGDVLVGGSAGAVQTAPSLTQPWN